MTIRHARRPRFITSCITAGAVCLALSSAVTPVAAETPPPAGAVSTTRLVTSPAPVDRASERARRPIYLTFDDGPVPAHTRELLKILKANGVSATFFVLGNLVRKNPEVVREEKAAGHAIGNHTWGHRELTRVSRREIVRQLVDGGKAIKSALGKNTGCMRPPYGSTNGTVRSVNRQLHLKQILWSVDTNDWRLPSVNTLTRRILNARPGDVVLMHDGGGPRSRTNAAVARALPKMVKRGDRFATVPSCL